MGPHPLPQILSGPVRSLFEIPIYRCSIGEHDQDVQKHVDSELAIYPKDRFPENYEKMRFWALFRADKGWLYNEIIGWLRLFTLGTDIRGEVFLVKERKRFGMVKKTFRYRGNELIVFPKSTTSSFEIYTLIRFEISRLSMRLPYKNRFFELSTFDNVGPLLPWREMVRGN